MSAQGTNFTWGGSQQFWLEGSQQFEDTLRIEANYVQEEQPLTLTLPTLCITYAVMSFTNAIGGEQSMFPTSGKYGPRFFSPPVEIVGEVEIEKITWIRGAYKVIIGPAETKIIWHMRDTLVIPRLRIEHAKSVRATLDIPNMAIDVDKPLVVDFMQLADGRVVGGIRMEKRHPQWQPREVQSDYDLWVRVVDGKTRQPMPEVTLKLLHWDQELAKSGWNGGFSLVDKRSTSSEGDVILPGRPSGDLDVVMLDLPGWWAVARCFRPLAGQQVTFHMAAWRLEEGSRPYFWNRHHSLEEIAARTGFAPKEILARNNLGSEWDLMEGLLIRLPCYEGAYHLEYEDTFEWLTQTFAYGSPVELAKLNGMFDLSELADLDEIKLPGWHFMYALPGDTLQQIDAMFGLPAGSSRMVGRVHHPDPATPYESETIAVPTEEFVKAYIEV